MYEPHPFPLEAVKPGIASDIMNNRNKDAVKSLNRVVMVGCDVLVHVY